MEKQEGLPLLELETAYKSLRESGFDFATAIGELIDNSIQAEAKRIEIKPKIVERKFVSVITQIAVIDDGNGMNAEILNGCPQLGYSTRYNDREGLGRFGVGATYASISQCKRTIFCSRPNGTGNFLATYIDLDEIANGGQTNIPKPSELHLPKYLEELCFADSSTIVVWEQCDRLQSDANGKPFQAKDLLDELTNWVSRAYRHSIWEGVEIYIEGEKVVAYDPLYLNTEQTQFPNDLCAIEYFTDSFDWPIPNSPDKTSSISVKLTLLPEAWRTKKGDGGSDFAKERRITENQGISVLRCHREVAFGNFYPITPRQRAIDRWWGCEINFEPELDECWEVKNVKRGARPTEELRKELRGRLISEISKMRKEIQDHWRTGVPADAVQHVHQAASSIMEGSDSLTVSEIAARLKEAEISTDDLSLIVEKLAIEKKWDWTTDTTHRRYTPSPPPLSGSERKEYFDGIKSTIENSNIEQRFKDIALYDLEQARISYKSRAFKACIVMFGAVIEGLMLGAIRRETTLKKMITMANQPDAPGTVKQIKKFQSSFSNLECLAENISKHLGFEDYKNITVHLKSEIEKLQITGIQSFRNSIHPWKSIKEPNIFHDPSQARAMHYLTALSILAEKILA